MNIIRTEVKNFYALATLGLNPDGTMAEDRPRSDVSSPAIATIAVPAKKKENA